MLLAAYFWNILKVEWRTLPETENFAEIRRLYRFIWMLYGLLMIIFGAQQALDYAFTFSTESMLGAIGRETVVNAIAVTKTKTRLTPSPAARERVGVRALNVDAILCLLKALAPTPGGVERQVCRDVLRTWEP